MQKTYLRVRQLRVCFCMQNGNLQHICWFIFDEPANILHACKIRTYNIFAGSFSSNQQISCTHVKFELTTYLLVHFRRTSKYLACMQNSNLQLICWFIFVEPANILHTCKIRTYNIFAGSFSTNQQISCTHRKKLFL
jgi:hypothetical protein